MVVYNIYMNATQVYKHNKFIMFLTNQNVKSNPAYIIFKVEKDKNGDSFEMIIPFFEAVANSNTTHGEYIRSSLEAIKHYLDL